MLNDEDGAVVKHRPTYGIVCEFVIFGELCTTEFPMPGVGIGICPG